MEIEMNEKRKCYKSCTTVKSITLRNIQDLVKDDIMSYFTLVGSD